VQPWLEDAITPSCLALGACVALLWGRTTFRKGGREGGTEDPYSCRAFMWSLGWKIPSHLPVSLSVLASLFSGAEQRSGRKGGREGQKTLIPVEPSCAASGNDTLHPLVLLWVLVSPVVEQPALLLSSRRHRATAPGRSFRTARSCYRDWPRRREGGREGGRDE